MNRNEFMDVLKNKLNKLPKEEFENAIKYYEEYFDEAGSENENKVIEELGSPYAVSSQIIAEFTLKKPLRYV